MGITIEDGLGSGEMAEVFDNRLRTFAVQDSLMNHLSVEPEHQTVYDTVGTITIASGITSASGGIVLFLQNNDPSRFIIIDRIYVQVAQPVAASLPQTSTYFSVGFGRTYLSGGTALNMVNENRFTTNTALATAVNVNGATLLGLTGTVTEALRFYPQAGPVFEIVPQAGDSIILTRGNSIEVDFSAGILGSGVALAVMRFAQVLPGHMG
jgi:hypothetical protein